MQRFLDISMAIENGVPSDPPGYGFDIRCIGHADTVPMLQKRYHGLRGKDLVGGEAFALEAVQLSTHNGTHVDAPWHSSSTMSDSTPSRTIDQMPLDWFFRPGAKLDFRAFEDGAIVQPGDIDRELDRIGHALQPYDIVVVNTSAGARFTMLDHAAVHDCGVVVNPGLVTGQLKGAIAVGIGAALWEELTYDVEGRLRTPTSSCPRRRVSGPPISSSSTRQAHGPS